MNGLNRALAQNNASMDEDEQAVLEIANALWVQKTLKYCNPIWIPSQKTTPPVCARLISRTLKGGRPDQSVGGGSHRRKDHRDRQTRHVQCRYAARFDQRGLLQGYLGAQFEESATRDEDFTLLDGTVISVPTMITSGTFPVWVNEHYQLIEMPYKGSTIAMDLIMPLDGDWDGFMEKLTEESLRANLAGLEQRDAI